MGMLSKLGVWIPHQLNGSQLNQRTDYIFFSFRQTFNWLDHLIAEKKTWIPDTNITEKRQWVEPKQQPEPTPKVKTHPK